MRALLLAAARCVHKVALSVITALCFCYYRVLYRPEICVCISLIVVVVVFAAAAFSFGRHVAAQ